MSSDYLKALNIGSGLDTTQIVDAIVNARRVPRENLINEDLNEREVKISGFSEIKKALSTFQNNLTVYSGINGLNIANNGTAVTASIANSNNVREFSYDIAVSNLASSQVLAFPNFTSADQSIGTGTLTFAFGTWTSGSFTSNGTTKNVVVGSGNDSLEGIAASINDADIGVTASVVKESDNSYILMLKSSEGAANAMQISVVEDNASNSLDQLSYTSYDASKELLAATNSALTIDGVPVTRTSNQITDLIDGVQLTLNSTTTKAETISASFDAETALLAAQGFVVELNNLITLLRSKSARGTESIAAGELAGDPLVKSMINQITDLTNQGIVGFGTQPIYLANYGILTNRDGSLSLNATKFKEQYADDPAAFDAILNSRVRTDSSMVSATITGDDYVPGNYSFTISGNNATFDAEAMVFSDNQYSTSSSNASGLSITLDGSGTNTTVRLGRSLLDKLKIFSTNQLAFGNDLDGRVSNYNEDISEYTKALSDFDKQMSALREQYIAQFAAMDSAVASLNRTKEALDMMMEGWRGSMKR